MRKTARHIKVRLEFSIDLERDIESLGEAGRWMDSDAFISAGCRAIGIKTGVIGPARMKVDMHWPRVASPGKERGE